MGLAMHPGLGNISHIYIYHIYIICIIYIYISDIILSYYTYVYICILYQWIGFVGKIYRKP